MTMAITSSTFLLLLAILTNISLTTNARHLFTSCIDQNGNYTANGTYQANLNSLLPSLIPNATLRSAGFYFSARGESPDRVFASLLCRGDLNLTDCRSCLNQSRHLIAQDCPDRKAAVIWYEECTLRYSDADFTGVMRTQPGFSVWITQNLTSTYAALDERLATLFEVLRMRAATTEGVGSEYPSRFAAGSVYAAEGVLVYGIVQCAPDLSDAACSDCVVYAVAYGRGCCFGTPYVYIGFLSCNVFYSFDPFFNASFDVRIQSPPPPPPPLSPPPPLPPTSQPTDGKVRKSGRSQIVITIVVPSVACFLVLAMCICLCLKMRTTEKTKTRFPFEAEAEDTDHYSAQSLQFDFPAIKSATNNFSEDNKIGQGGFGTVYKGRLSNGQDIAVKRLISRTDQCQSAKQKDLDFKNEVLLVAKLTHRNLVNLLGFCLEKKERILVYKFMPNSSLDHFLFDSNKREHLLDWNRRYNIVTGVARGLLYLHEESRLKIIHRDLKAGNILLDADMLPKISDFGTARLFDIDQSKEKTKQIAGTYGYMPPEYAKRGEFSVKSDVFSFGVLTLEIICGQRVKDFQGGAEKQESLLTYAWKSWKEGKAMKLVDPKMRKASKHEIMRCIHVGLLCVQEKSVDRPTMGSVFLMLSSYSLSLRRPSRPAYFVHSNSQSRPITMSNRSENNRAQLSIITELYPR